MTRKDATIPAIRCERALVTRLQAKADALFCSLSDYIRDSLQEVAERDDEPLPPDGYKAERQRGVELDNERKAMENREARGELVRKDAVVLMYRKHIAPIRQAIYQFEHAVSDLSPEQKTEVKKWIEDTLTELSTPQALAAKIKEPAQ
jgi:hypothetical protein